MSVSVGNKSGFVFFQQSFVSVLFGSGYSSFAFIPFFIYKPVTVRHYNRISLSSHVAVMAEKKCSGDINKGYGTKNERWEKKKKEKHLLQCPHSATFCGFKCHSNDDVFGALRWPPACMAADAPQL